MPDSRRTTIYFDQLLYRALRLKAAEIERSVSDLVNEAVHLRLSEDAEDLAAFDDRSHEPDLKFLPPHQDAFVDALVSAGRYRTASEVVREGLRLLEQSEHRRLLEKWIYDGLSEQEAEQLPADLKARARAHFRGLVDATMQDVEYGRVTDGPTAMRRLRKQLEARSD